MPDAYTYIAKPTSSVYSSINLQGKQTYDQMDVSYDDTNVYYDSVNDEAYTSVGKPAAYALVRPGMATGLIIPPTYSTERVVGDPWVKVRKPTT